MRKCAYCDFYSIASRSKKERFADRIVKEAELRKDFLGGEPVETIYFGGGPSQLPIEQIELILNGVSNVFPISASPEITLEANPDDLGKQILRTYNHVGINRLSIGVQSFNDNELQFLGRRHDAAKAQLAVRDGQDAGFSNISIDLIYGIPGSSRGSWEQSLAIAFNLGVQHLSCYHLTIEKDTQLYNKLNFKVFEPINEDLSLAQFDSLCHFADQFQFIHYELSNLAREGFFSQHNSSYWRGIPYLGLGPAAHSFNGLSRQWNPRSFDPWAKGIDSGLLPIEGELLDKSTKYNELLITHLRTIWGLNVAMVEQELGKNYTDHMLRSAKPHLAGNRLAIENGVMRIPRSAFFISDSIIADLLWV
jgi:oxygen-independent coproporphyrinogen-3 oxidase